MQTLVVKYLVKGTECGDGPLGGTALDVCAVFELPSPLLQDEGSDCERCVSLCEQLTDILQG